MLRVQPLSLWEGPPRPLGPQLHGQGQPEVLHAGHAAHSAGLAAPAAPAQCPRPAQLHVRGGDVHSAVSAPASLIFLLLADLQGFLLASMMFTMQMCVICTGRTRVRQLQRCSQAHCPLRKGSGSMDSSKLGSHIPPFPLRRGSRAFHSL